MKWKTLLLFWSALTAFAAAAQPLVPHLQLATKPGGDSGVLRIHPLDTVVVTDAGYGTVEVRDGAEHAYFCARVAGSLKFIAGGALGRQEVRICDPRGRETGRLAFELEAETSVDDGGKYRDMFNLFRDSMKSDFPDGVASTVWNGRTYHFFASWVLDNYHTAKGMKYFSPYARDFVDMMHAAQRADGMIWSNINPGSAVAYYKTAYGPFGYIQKEGDRYFVRQPTENHPEALYVSTIYQSWKAGAGEDWTVKQLDSAEKALNYSVSDPARWSQRFKLLKRVYTIDSWDFEVDDAYTPDIGLTNTMLIDPAKSKFGVFFGDNLHYATACDELVEMLEAFHRLGPIFRFRDRAAAIRRNLDALAWNGRFFTHFIDEDPTVKRDLGVDEKSQIAQGNAYALSRGVSHEQAKAIIQTYQELQKNLPPGSPGEWYAIYPPFPKGFQLHDKPWQYMNGGVGGHVAGELARGAFENGFEIYARDILDRLTQLGHAHGDKIWFAYTGSIPPPPAPPHFRPIDLAAVTNMDIDHQGGPGVMPWMQMPKPGDDIRGLPTGSQKFSGIDFNVTDPAKNERKTAVAVSHRAGFSPAVDVKVNEKAGAIYLLHTSTKPTSEKVCGSVAFLYADGSRQSQYLIMDKQLTFWWFPELKTETSGIAWHGSSLVSDDVGVSWCAIDNPHPEKTIAAIRFQAPEDDGIYAVLGLTLSDQPHYIPTNPVSFGGPDDWAAATAMAAMMEGMVGVKDAYLTRAFSHPILAPRWDLSRNEAILATTRYEASKGYVTYRYDYRATAQEIAVTVTGSGKSMDCHFLLPPEIVAVKSVLVDGEAVPSKITQVESSRYVDFALDSSRPRKIRIRFQL